jgi:cytochrome c553
MKIVLSVALATLILVGCGDNASATEKTASHAQESHAQKAATDMTSALTSTLKEVAPGVSKTVEDLKAASPELAKHVESVTAAVTEKLKEAAPEISKKVEELKAASPEVTEKIKAVTAALVATSKEKTEEVTKKVEEVKHEATKKVEEAKHEAAAHVDGAKLFTSCVGCHGAHAEKHALGKSQIIKGWSVDKVETALHGYKDGTYGASMKALMKGQVSKLSDADIKALAEHISKL